MAEKKNDIIRKQKETNKKRLSLPPTDSKPPMPAVKPPKKNKV